MISIERIPTTERVDYGALAKRLEKGPLYVSPEEIDPGKTGMYYTAIRRYIPGFQLKCRTTYLIREDGGELEVVRMVLEPVK